MSRSACARGDVLGSVSLCDCISACLYMSVPRVSLPDRLRAPFHKASGVCSASNHVRCDKFKNSLHV